MTKETWTWKNYGDSGELVAPDGTSYFGYDAYTREYKINPESEYRNEFNRDEAEEYIRQKFPDAEIEFKTERIDLDYHPEDDIKSQAIDPLPDFSDVDEAMELAAEAAVNQMYGDDFITRMEHDDYEAELARLAEQDAEPEWTDADIAQGEYVDALTDAWEKHYEELVNAEKERHQTDKYFDSRGNLKWNDIRDGYNAYWQEMPDGTYLEKSEQNAPDYMLAVGTSFADIQNEYEELGDDYDYRNDERIHHFESDTDLDKYVIDNYNVKSERQIISELADKDIYINTPTNEFRYSFDKEYYKDADKRLEKEIEDMRTKYLFAELKDTLSEGTVFVGKNKTLGDIQIRRGNKNTGLVHIIERRYAERVLNQKVLMDPEQAKKEITAISFLVADSLEKQEAIKQANGNWKIDNNGIEAIISKDAKGRFVLTGYDDNRQKKEATESINAVIAKYGNSPGFLGVYGQVGAVIASSQNNIPQEQSSVNEKSQTSQKTDWNEIDEKEWEDDMREAEEADKMRAELEVKRILDTSSLMHQVDFIDWFNKNKSDRTLPLDDYKVAEKLMDAFIDANSPIGDEKVHIVEFTNGKFGYQKELPYISDEKYLYACSADKFLQWAYEELRDKTKVYERETDKNYRSLSEENKANSNIRIMLQDKDLLAYMSKRITDEEYLSKVRMGNLSFEKNQEGKFFEATQFYDDHAATADELKKTVRASDVYAEVKEIIDENINFEWLKNSTMDYLYNRSVDEAAGWENPIKKNEPQFQQLDTNIQNILKKYDEHKIDFDDTALAIKISGTRNGDLNKAKRLMAEQIENSKATRILAAEKKLKNDNDYADPIEWTDADIAQDQVDFMDWYKDLNKRTADLEYIHSEEFISKFGDWEKAQRIERLRAAPSVISDGIVEIDGIDYSSDVQNFRDTDNTKMLRLIALQVGKTVTGEYNSPEMGGNVLLSMTNIREINNHTIKAQGQVESITCIPELIKNGIKIHEEKNYDKQKHPNIEKYTFLVSGLKLGDEDYTCKSVIATDTDGHHYYDHRLSQIEKGRILDNLAPLHKQGEINIALVNYDKRLIEICQCPQLEYLDENLMPTKEAVEAVKAGTLFVEKTRNGVQILHDTVNDKHIGKELNDLLEAKGQNIVVNKIKTPEQVLYVSTEVGRVIEQRTQENAQLIVNPTRVFNTEPPNPLYQKEQNSVNKNTQTSETNLQQQKDIKQDFNNIATAMKNDSSFEFENPQLGTIVFTNGTLGNLEKKNPGGYGMKHIVASRYLKDGMIQQDIASLLYLVKDTAATVAPSDDDISLNKQSLNLQKDGIWVTVRKNWNDTDENWILTGFGINDDKGQMTKEAQDTIKVVSTQYGYTPEHLSISEQVGACMTSINNIVNQISDDVKQKLYPNFTPQQISQETLQQKYDDLHAKVYEHCTVNVDDERAAMTKEFREGNCEKNLLHFSNPKFYEEAATLSKEEILSKYGDTPMPIATIPIEDCVFKGIYNDVKDNHVYTGLGSFVDHWVNHHPEMEPEDFQNMQEVFNNPSKRYFDKSKNAVVFEKEINGLKDVVFVKKAQDKLLYERSNYLVKKVPTRWMEISPVDGQPTISQSERTEAAIARNISARDDIRSKTNIPQEQNSVNKNPQTPQETLQQKYDDLHAKVYEHCTVNVDDKKCELKEGLLNGFYDVRKELEQWQSMTPKDLRKLANNMERQNKNSVER